MTFSRDLGWLDTDEIPGVIKGATQAGNIVPERDAQLIPAIIAACKAGVEAMGGKSVHVFIGGGVRRGADSNDAPESAVSQKSFTVVITTQEVLP